MIPTNLHDLYQHGGLTLIAILMLSVVALAVGLERFLAVWTYRKRLFISAERILLHLSEKNFTMAQAVNQSLPWHPGTELFAKILTTDEVNLSEIKRSQNKVIRRVRRRLWMLASIGAIAPFVGLFGTVIGVMEAFQQMAAQGSGGFGVVSSGISSALIATAGGIFVGIEAVVLFNYLQVYVNDYTALLKEAVEEILEKVRMCI